jgi:hypothetical protein
MMDRRVTEPLLDDLEPQLQSALAAALADTAKRFKSVSSPVTNSKVDSADQIRAERLGGAHGGQTTTHRVRLSPGRDRPLRLVFVGNSDGRRRRSRAAPRASGT